MIFSFISFVLFSVYFHSFFTKPHFIFFFFYDSYIPFCPCLTVLFCSIIPSLSYYLFVPYCLFLFYYSFIFLFHIILIISFLPFIVSFSLFIISLSPLLFQFYHFVPYCSFSSFIIHFHPLLFVFIPYFRFIFHFLFNFSFFIFHFSFFISFLLFIYFHSGLGLGWFGLGLRLGKLYSGLHNGFRFLVSSIIL